MKINPVETAEIAKSTEISTETSTTENKNNVADKADTTPEIVVDSNDEDAILSENASSVGLEKAGSSALKKAYLANILRNAAGRNIASTKTTENKETGETTKTAFDSNGKVVKEAVKAKDGSVTKSEYTYEADGKYVKVTKDEKNNQVIREGFDANGKILESAKKNQNGIIERTTYTYNEDGSYTVTVKNAQTGTKEVTSFDKDGVKLRTVTTDKNGIKTTKQFNPDGTLQA